MISHDDLIYWCGYCLFYAFSVVLAGGVSFLFYMLACVIIEMIQKQARAARSTKQYLSWLRFRRRYNKRTASIERPKPKRRKLK